MVRRSRRSGTAGALDIGRQVGIARFSAVPGRILAFGHPKPILPALGFLHVLGLDLRDLERAEADVCAELDNYVVPVAGGRPAEVLDLPIGQLDFHFVGGLGRFQAHTGYFLIF